MIDTTSIDRWLEAYQGAWRTDAPEDIAALFPPGARYYTAPFRAPKTGVDEIVAWWVGQENATIPWTFTYDIVAREGDRYVVRGVTRYPEGFEPGGAEEVYDNIWLVTLDPDGRATEFIEYWMLRD